MSSAASRPSTSPMWQTDARRRRRTSDHRFDTGADVLDVKVRAHERDHVGRVLHEVAEVRAALFDAPRRPPRPPWPTIRACATISARQTNVDAGDGVRDGRPHDRRRESDCDRDLAAEDCNRAPPETRPPRARAVNAHRVGDADREADDENRAPSRRVDDPSGADRGGRGAKVEAPRRREPCFQRDHGGVAGAARERAGRPGAGAAYPRSGARAAATGWRRWRPVRPRRRAATCPPLASHGPVSFTERAIG